MEKHVKQISEFLSPDCWFQFPTLVAVSGGSDSVALLRILAELSNRHNCDPQSLHVAHVNHGTRGIESDQDESFVRQLADQLNLNCHVASCQPVSSNPSEQSLRDIRYDALCDMAQQVGARYIATGHSQDDQVETVLFRIFRGTGLSGLSGIPPIRVVDQTISIVRPLLDCRRSDLIALLNELKQGFRTDGSNSDSYYSRNYLRNEILPILRDRFGISLDDAISRLSEQAVENQAFLDQQIDELEQAVNYQDKHRLVVQLARIRLAPPLLIRHLLIRCWDDLHWPRQSMTHIWWLQIAEALIQNNPVEKILNLPADIRLEINQETATFIRQ